MTIIQFLLKTAKQRFPESVISKCLNRDTWYSCIVFSRKKISFWYNTQDKSTHVISENYRDFLHKYLEEIFLETLADVGVKGANAGNQLRKLMLKGGRVKANRVKNN